MFPNPQDALPLPPRPSLERCKKLAKELVKACKSGDEEAIGCWAEQWIRKLEKLAAQKNTHQTLARIDRWSENVEDFARRELSDGEPTGRKCALADAQFVIARSHGFESWPKFAKHLEAIAAPRAEADRRDFHARARRHVADLRCGERRGRIPAEDAEQYRRDHGD